MVTKYEIVLWEPHQLTKFTSLVHSNNICQRTFQLKDIITIFLGFQTLSPYSLTKPDLSELGRSFGLVLSKTKSVTFEDFRANILNLINLQPSFLRQNVQNAKVKSETSYLCIACLSGEYQISDPELMFFIITQKNDNCK